ncbi:MAG: hypothetical protein ABH833_02120 [Parcubacteria group bacterium]
MHTFFTVTAYIKLVAIYLSLVLTIGLIMIVYHIFGMVRKEKKKLMHILDEPETPQDAQRMYADDWEQIKRSSTSLQEAEWKLSIIQADKLVDEMLRTKGYEGESMGERLKSIDPNSFSSLQDVWEAHKLRNLLVHDMNYAVSKGQAVGAVESFERFLHELGFFA